MRQRSFQDTTGRGGAVGRQGEEGLIAHPCTSGGSHRPSEGGGGQGGSERSGSWVWVLELWLQQCPRYPKSGKVAGGLGPLLCSEEGLHTVEDRSD